MQVYKTFNQYGDQELLWRWDEEAQVGSWRLPDGAFHEKSRLTLAEIASFNFELIDDFVVEGGW